MQEERIDITRLRLGIVINAASGGSDSSTREKMQAVLAEAGVSEAKFWEVEGEGLAAALTEAQAFDVLVVFGGDGTIRTAAQMSTMEGPRLIALPGGTMNLLPKALYGELAWEDALLATLRDPMVRTISGGKAGDERFFIAAILGAPALWAKAREALREGDLAVALEEGKEAIEHLFASKVAYRFNELHEGTAEAVSIVCPLISTALADDRQVLEAAVIDVADAGEVIELATAAAFGQWRDSKNVAIVNTKEITISSSMRVPAIFDGEIIHAGKELHIEFVPEAFRAVVPAI